MIALKELEERTFLEDDTAEIPPSDIIAYNELRSCADLYRMYTEGILEIQPEFQREIVWKTPSQTRFIDSLIKQLPIPSMCFSLDYKTQEWQVIDGLQRMATIIRFLSGNDWTLSKLDDVDPKISGQRLSKFLDPKSELNAYYKRVQNLTLPITVLRCDYSKKHHMNYLFTIFHRLNTGGMKLNNQEIRNCIFSGQFNELLKRLNTTSNWMKLNRMTDDAGYRFTKQEIILRFFAFHDRYRKYDGKLARFLNEYMGEYRNPCDKFLEKKEEIFSRTVNAVYKKIFNGKIPPKLSVAVLEAVLVGVSLNLNYIESEAEEKVNHLYEKLLRQEEFNEENLRQGLAAKTKVIGRMQKAERVFSGE
ncbi:MAG: DUF262 domain-containing protein [Blastocatellia bacterium]|nr:DUF262 domain-containing protein [Blastocatellia bacterium]